MSDAWINRLEISGPPKDLAAVERAMTPVKAAGSRSRRLDLSFKALSEYLAIGCVICAEDVTEPWGVTVERRERLERGMVRRIYRFEQARYEPDELLVGLSARFPRLCFVHGWVMPDSEEASKLIHKGTARRFDLSQKRRNEIYADIDDDEDPHVAFWMAVKSDWAALEEVVAHWAGTVQRILGRIAANDLSAPGEKRPRRSSRETDGKVPWHVHRLSGDGWPSQRIDDWDTVNRLLGQTITRLPGTEVLSLPDGGYARWLGSKAALTVEIRECRAGGAFTHWVIGRGPLTGKPAVVRGPDSTERVDSSQVLTLRDAQSIFRAFLQLRAIPARYNRTDVTARFRKGKGRQPAARP
ncbi:MAG: hypothetical protein U0529_19925 [Thermoanaerobaculia bacterium]